MSELTIKNHFVPELYLKQWQDQEEDVCTYKTLVSHKKQRVWKKYKAGAIGYHRHLYTRLVGGIETDEFETWFDKSFESPATPVIEKVLTDSRLSPDDWFILVRFLAAQDVRTPARLVEHMTRSPSSLQKTMDESLDRLKSQTDNGESEYDDYLNVTNRYLPLKIEKITDPDTGGLKLKIESYVGRATWLHSMRFLLEHTSKVLHEHKWSIVKPAKGYTWFTSDNPVIKLNFEDENSYDFGGGWGRKHGNIIFPLGPEHAMFVQIGDRPMPKGTRLTVNQTNLIRKFIAENGYRRIFSNSFDDEIVRLRPRELDQLRVNLEKKQFDEWHEVNSSFEKEYF